MEYIKMAENVYSTAKIVSKKDDVEKYELVSFIKNDPEPEPGVIDEELGQDIADNKDSKENRVKEEEKKVTDRINELYHKKEKEGLTPEEEAEIEQRKLPPVDTRTYAEKRTAEYPDFRDYLDGIVKGDQAQVQAYIMTHQYESLLKKANFKAGGIFPAR